MTTIMGFVKVTKEDIIEKLKKVGLQKGDMVYVASFIPVLGKSPTLLEDTIEALITVVGGEGTVVMPTFNWGYCNGDVFDPIKTPSKVGVLTEAFRKYTGVLRSVTPPWCTFAAIGKNANEIVAIEGTSSFGSNGIVQYLYDRNTRYILLGCPYEDAVIHLHWLEEKYEVAYRFWKQFKGQININGKLIDNVSYMYARRTDIDTEIDSSSMTRLFDESDKVSIEKIGLGHLRSFLVKDYVEFMTPYLEKDKNCLLPKDSSGYFE